MTTFPAAVPIPERFNGMTVSMFIWAHPMIKRCPSCGQAYNFVIQAMKDVQAGYVPVDQPEERRIVPATVVPS
jgi:hypothetical protein